MWRHGDVLISAVEEIPQGARRIQGVVLASGEVTGHSHRVETAQAAQLWEDAGERFLTILETTRVIHDEHQPITLSPGNYRVWQQREYTPQAMRRAVRSERLFI